MADPTYTPEQIKEYAAFLSAHPDQIPPELKSTVPGTEIGKQLASTSLQEENERLKEQLETQSKHQAYATTIAVKSAIEQREAEIAQKTKEDAEWNKTVQDLYSCMSKSTADKILADKPSILVLKSVIESVKGSGAARVGVAAGIEMRSTMSIRDRMTSLSIPSIEFQTRGD